jgi:hypothetical protein
VKGVLGFLVAVGRFLYGYIFGDDWVVAVVMLIAIAASAALVHNGVNAWWLVPPAAVVMTGISLLRGRTPG